MESNEFRVLTKEEFLTSNDKKKKQYAKDLVNYVKKKSKKRNEKLDKAEKDVLEAFRDLENRYGDS